MRCQHLLDGRLHAKQELCYIMNQCQLILGCSHGSARCGSPLISDRSISKFTDIIENDSGSNRDSEVIKQSQVLVNEILRTLHMSVWYLILADTSYRPTFDPDVASS